MKRFRLAAVTGDPETPATVDRETGLIRGCSAAQACEALGHGVCLDDTTIQQVVDLGNAAGGKGLKCRFTHPGMCADGLGTLVGHARNFRVAGDKAVCDLQLADVAKSGPKGDLYAYVLDLAEKDPEDFGMSIVFSGDAVWKCDDGSEVPVEMDDDGNVVKPDNCSDAMPVVRIDDLSAADLVDEPAANRDGLFSAAFTATSSAKAEQAFREIDALLDRFGIDVPTARQFADRYVAARVRTAAPAAANKEKTVTITPQRMAELCEAHPQQATVISKLFAAGKSEEQIMNGILSTKCEALLASHKDLGDKLSAQAEKHKQALSDKDTAHQAMSDKLTALQAKYDDLAALGRGTRDPGGAAGTSDPTTVDATCRQEFAASAELREEFGNDLDSYIAFKKNGDHMPALTFGTKKKG